MDIPGLSVDGHSYSGIHGYSNMEGGEGWTSLEYPWMVRVTLAYRDTLTWGGGGVRVDVSGLSMDGHSYSQLSAKQLCCPWMAVDCLRHHWIYLANSSLVPRPSCVRRLQYEIIVEACPYNDTGLSLAGKREEVLHKKHTGIVCKKLCLSYISSNRKCFLVKCF